MTRTNPEAVKVVIDTLMAYYAPRNPGQCLRRWLHATFEQDCPITTVEFAGSLTGTREQLRADDLENFLYFRAPDLVVGNMRPGSHEPVLSTLEYIENCASLVDPWSCYHRERKDWKDLQTDFLLKGRGYFLSGSHQSPFLQVGEDYPWSAQEKRLFRGWAKRVHGSREHGE